MAVIPPRTPGNVADVVLSRMLGGTETVILFRLASNGTVLGVPKTLADGLEGIPAGTVGFGTKFGSSLQSLGDLDGDGVYDVSIGAMDDVDASDDEVEMTSGAVYILFLNPGNEADAVKSFLKITPFTGGLSRVAPRGR